MSFRRWLSEQLSLAFLPLQILLYLDWKAEAQRTGQTYEAVANAHVEQWTDTLVDAGMAIAKSLPPRVALLVFSAPLFAYLGVKLYRLIGIVEVMVYRHGIVRTTVAGGVFAFATMAWIEYANELPPWARPETAPTIGM